MQYKERFLERRASIFKRLFAFVADLFILNFVVVYPFSELISYYNSGFTNISQGMYVIVVIISLLALGYFVLMEWYFKKTLGMMLLRIEASGNINFLTALTRHLYLVPMFPFSLLIIIDPLWLLFKGERLTEKITRTKTIERIRMV